MNKMSVCVRAKAGTLFLLLGILSALSKFMVPMSHQFSWANEQPVLVVDTAWMTSSFQAKM